MKVSYDSDVFSRDYAEARTRFLNAAERLRWRCESYPISAKGPGGIGLSLDVAISPAPEGTPGLVISSGLHGVEGFLGSAVQLQHLRHWANASFSGHVRLILLHALNPYGFAWLRRCDDQNRDLNRSFLLDEDTSALHRFDLYERLDPWLNPKSPPREWSPFLGPAVLNILRHGYGPVQDAIAGGQYEFPKGLFFGGGGPPEMQEILSIHLPQWLADCSRVMHLDLHSGLGKWGDLLLVLENPAPEINHVHLKEVNRWIAPDVLCHPGAEKEIYEITGGFGRWCCANAQIDDYMFAGAEFGTYGPLRVLRILRDENRQYHWGESNRYGSSGTRDSGSADALTPSKAQREMLEAFCPSSPRWRAQVLGRSFRLIERMIDGLQSASRRNS